MTAKNKILIALTVGAAAADLGLAAARHVQKQGLAVRSAAIGYWKMLKNGSMVVDRDQYDQDNVIDVTAEVTDG